MPTPAAGSILTSRRPASPSSIRPALPSGGSSGHQSFLWLPSPKINPSALPDSYAPYTPLSSSTSTSSDLYRYTSEAMSPTGGGFSSSSDGVGGGRGRSSSSGSSSTIFDPSLTLAPIRDPRYAAGTGSSLLGRPPLDRGFPSFDTSMPPPTRPPMRARGGSSSYFPSPQHNHPSITSLAGGDHLSPRPINLQPIRSRRSSLATMDVDADQGYGLSSLASGLLLGPSSPSSQGSCSPSLSTFPSSNLPSLPRTLNHGAATGHNRRRGSDAINPRSGPLTSPGKLSSTEGVPTTSTGHQSHASRGLRKFSKRTTFSHHQLQLMENLWAKTEYPSVDEVDKCAEEAGLAPKQIRTWFGNTRQARLAGTRKEARVGGVAPGHRRIDYDDSYPALSSKHVPTPKSSLRPVSMLGMPGSLEVSYEGGFGNVKNGGLGPLPLFPPAPPARPSSRNSNGGRGMDTLPPLPSLGDGGNGSRSRRNSFAGPGDRFMGSSTPDLPAFPRYQPGYPDRL